MYTAKRGYRPGDEPVPQYHLTKFLGRGQFGEVWQAKGPGGMQVALKIIDLGEREGLKEFAGLQRVKDIRHANLVEFVACWVKTEDGRVLDEVPADPVAAVSPRDSSVAIGGTMLFAEGASSPSRPVELIVAMSLGSKTLFKRLQEINHGKEQKDWAGIPDEELLDYMEQAARGIDFLNQQGIIHGDIKPQNLLIVGNSVKVCDFGLAQAVDSLRKTQSGMGTVAYAAPELFEGKPNIQSDQYCLAVSYVELRTGSLPFDEPNPYKVIELHRHGKLDLQRLTSSDRKIIKRATEIKPEKRWPTCFEMVTRLRESRQERSGRGGILASIFGGVRSPPTERFSTVEPPSIPDELLQPGSGGKPGSKKGSGGAAMAKPDSNKKGSGPRSALEPRVIRTQHGRGDDTDAIAATMASDDIQGPPQPEPLPSPSVVGRLLKVAAVLCLLCGMGYGVYKVILPYIGGDPPPIKTWTELVRRGEFDKAVEIDVAQKTKPVVEYEKWQADFRRIWSEPATNPILQRLSPNAPDAVDPREVRTLLEKAETHDGFRKLVEGVPEGLWQPVRDAWKREFEEAVGRALDVDALDRLVKELDSAPEKDVPPIVREQLRTRLGQAYFVLIRDAIDKGNFLQAAEAASKAEGRLPLAQYEQSCNEIRKEWSGAATNPVLQQYTKGKIQVSDAIIRLKHADSEPGFVKLAGPVPEGVWQAVLKPGLSDFDARVAKGEFKEAAGVLTDAKKQLVGERHLQLCGAAKKEWSEPSTNHVLLQLKEGTLPSREGFLRLKSADAEESFVKLVGPVPAAVWQSVFEQWMKQFDGLLAGDLQKAVEEWKAVNKLEDTPSEVITPTQRTGLRGRLQEAWKKQTKFADLVANHDFRGVKDELTRPLAGEIFDETGLGEIRKEVQPKWTVYFDKLVEAPEPEKLAKATQELKNVGKFFDSEEQYKEKVAKFRKVWNKGIGDLVSKANWAAATTLLGAAEGIVPQQERDAEHQGIQAAFDKVFDENLAPPADKGKLDNGETMLAGVERVELFSQAEIDKKRQRIRLVALEMEQKKWDAEFQLLVDTKKWEDAKKNLDGVSKGLFSDKELGERLVRLQTAWKADFEPLVADKQLKKAEEMLAGATSVRLFEPEEIARLQEPILQVPMQMWLAALEDAIKKRDWTLAAKTLDSPPKGLPDIMPYRKKLVDSWDEEFKPHVAKGEWEAAKAMLDAAEKARLFGKTERDDRLAQIQKPWGAGFTKLVADNDLESARTMLAKASDIQLFLKPEIGEKARAIEDREYAEWLKQFDKLFTELVGAGKYQEANDKLDEPMAQQRLRRDGVQTRREGLCKEWIKSIRAIGDKSGEEAKLKEESDAFLKVATERSDMDDVRLFRARALVRLGMPDEAATELQRLDQLPADRGRFREALLAIATKTPKDPKDFDNLVVPWKLNSWEEQQLKGMMKPPPPPPGSPIAAVKKALEAIDATDAKPEAAGQLLDALEKHYPSGDPGNWVVPEREEDVTLLTATVPLTLRKLALDVAEGGRPEYENQGKDLGRAKTWLLAAKAKFPLPEIGSAAYAAATGRLALRVWEPPKPAQADLQEIQEWDQLPKGPAAAGTAGIELMAKAWRAECMLALGQNATTARTSVMLIRDDLAKKAKQPAYARYLWCRGLKAAGSSWEDIEPDLFELSPALEGPDPILKAQDRVGTMAELIVEAAGQHRKRSGPWKLDKIPFNPFADSAEAEQYAKLLKAVGKGAAGDGRQRELKTNLALAEFHSAKPALAEVWPATRELLSLPNAGADPDIVPLLYAGASSFWQQPSLVELPADDPQFTAAVRATAQLLRELGKDDAGRFSQEGPKALYASVLKPILDADFQARAEARKQTGEESLSRLAGAVAEFLESQADAQWPSWPERFRDIHDVIENQANLAIDLAPKGKPDSARLGDYFAMRANARAYKPDFKADEVLKDAETALSHRPSKPHRAFGAQTYALLMRAGERDKRENILRDLSEAIAAGQQAVKSCPEEQKAYPTYSLNLGIAHLRLGNYESDADKKKQHLDAGREAATRAARGEHEYGDEARLLLGNIYEDLASQAGESPRQNYQEALKRFSEVLQHNSLSAQASCSLARCTLKAIARSRIDPREMGLGDRDAALKGCVRDLNRAVEYALNDTVRIEAQYYLGEVYDELGDRTRAEENMRQAADLAIKSKASTQAAYIYGWAMLALNQAKRLLATRSATDPEVDKLLQAAEQRAEILRKTPAGAFIVPTKQVAVILGAVRQMRREYDRAASAYDDAIPELAQADALDVPLLMARADCNLNRPEFRKEASFAEAVVRDATRARELAPSEREQADAHYRLALGHFQLFQLGGSAAFEHRNKSLEAVREAVRLVPPGATGVSYRSNGAKMILNVVVDWGRTIDKGDEQALAAFAQQTIPFLEEGEKWLKDALGMEQDAGEKKKIEADLKVIQKLIEDRRRPPAAPVPPTSE